MQYCASITDNSANTCVTFNGGAQVYCHMWLEFAGGSHAACSKVFLFVVLPARKCMLN